MSAKRKILLASAILPFLVLASASAEEQALSGLPVQFEGASNASDSSANVISRSTRVTRNPGTGQIEFEPAAPIPVLGLSARERNMLSRSDEGLQARLLANRAVAVNLQGRFQTMATATADQDTGQLTTVCSIDDGAHPGDTVELEAAE